MPAIHHLLPLAFRRDVPAATPPPPASSVRALDAAVSVAIFLAVSLCLLLGLLLVRRTRAKRRRAGSHSLTIHAADLHGESKVLVFNRPMLANPNSAPSAPDNVPAIHITFPDETDARGHCSGGRVVVVRIGDTGVGLEPFRASLEKSSFGMLPPYRDDDPAHPFVPLDMDSIGGLVEKDRSGFW